MAQIPVPILEDENITSSCFKLYGILSSICDFNRECDPKKEDLAERMGVKPQTVKSRLIELRDKGWLDFTDNRQEERFNIELYFQKQETPSSPEKDKDVQKEKNKLQKIEDGDKVKIKLRKKYDKKPPNQLTRKEKVNELMGLFKETVDKTLEYGHKGNRKAFRELIEGYGFRKVYKSILYYIKEASDDQYAPIINSPIQLKKKFVNLAMYKKRSESKSKSDTLMMQ